MTTVYIVWDLTRREKGEGDTLVEVCASRSLADKVALEEGLVEENIDYGIEEREVRT